MNKREFVLATGGALTTGIGWAAAPAGPAAAATVVPADFSLAGFNLAGWQARVGQQFEVLGVAQPAQLRLQQVHSHPADQRSDAPQTAQFTLVFEAAGSALAAGTQLLRQPAGAATALYLDPAGRDATGAPLLRAHFCQLV